MTICPKCNGDLFPVYFDDNIKRWRCWQCNRIFKESEWIERDGELVRRYKEKQQI